MRRVCEGEEGVEEGEGVRTHQTARCKLLVKYVTCKTVCVCVCVCEYHVKKYMILASFTCTQKVKQNKSFTHVHYL